MDVGMILAVAVVSEAVWETLKMTWEQGKVQVDTIGAIVIALVIAFAAGIDVFEVVGAPLGVPFLGIALTGLLISRGANVVHDIFNRIRPK